MKSFALAALLAVVSANVNTDMTGAADGGAWTELVVANNEPADWKACKTECETKIAAAAVKTHHYCCMAIDTAEIKADSAATPPVEGRVASV